MVSAASGLVEVMADSVNSGLCGDKQLVRTAMAAAVFALGVAVGDALAGRSEGRIAAAAVLGPSPALSTEPGTAAHAEPQHRRCLGMFARAYYPGRSGQIFLVPREGEVIAPGDSFYQLMHGSPWEYDTAIPLLFYGPGCIRAGEYTGKVGQQDVLPTLAALLHLDTPSTVTGRVLRAALRADAEVPAAVVVLVLDGARADYFSHHAASMPYLDHLRRAGAWFAEAHIDYAPTNTAVGHTTISTGSDPRIHGVVGNSIYDAVAGRKRKAYAGCSPRDLVVPALADLWMAQGGGRAVVIAQGGNEPSATALAGHGACGSGGRPVRMASYRYSDAEGGWTAGEGACFALSPPVRELHARALWAGAGSWMGHDIRGGKRLRHSALFARFEGDAAVAAIAADSLGMDGVRGLVLVNLKTIDFVGHTYGPDSPEIVPALAAVDAQVGRIVAAVERKVGASGYVLAVTADHGMPAAPPARRHRSQELVDSILARFDPSARRLLLSYESEDSQLYFDAERMRELGLAPETVARYIETIPYIFAAYTEAEVREAAAELAGR